MAGPWKISEPDVRMFPRAMSSGRIQLSRKLPKLLIVVVKVAVTSIPPIKLVVVNFDFEPAKVWSLLPALDVQGEAESCFVTICVLIMNSEQV